MPLTIELADLDFSEVLGMRSTIAVFCLQSSAIKKWQT